MTHTIRPLTLAERLTVVSDYRKAEEYNRSIGNHMVAQKYANMADGFDPYYIQVDLVDDNGNIVLPADFDEIDEKW